MNTLNLFPNIEHEASADAVALVERAAGMLRGLSLEQRVATLNAMRAILHEESPFKGEPVDYVRWLSASAVQANDYNPNSVAPPEMELLRLSIDADGYTQPIVSWPVEGGYEVVDGFHRTRVGKESAAIQERLHGYLPLVVIQPDRTGREDRIAATIRHNRARGKHRIDAMSEIVVELRRRNWSPAKIGRELGMDQDEVLRLCQITGLTEMFADSAFSEAWEADHLEETDFEPNISPVLEMGGNGKLDVEAPGE